MKNVKSLMLLCAVVILAMGVSVSSSGEDGHSYVGVKKCKPCHLKQFKSWAETKMAKSFDLLKPGERAEQKTAAGLDPAKDYTTDAECVRCHSTGYGQPGGFVDFASTPQLAGVTCEMCHGAGGTYTKPAHMSLKNKEYKKADLVAVGLVGEITLEVCSGCHNTESPFVGDDYVFDFEAKKETGTHKKYPLKYKH